MKSLETANFGASQLAAGVLANPQVILEYSSAMIYAENMVCQGGTDPVYAGGDTAKGVSIASGYVTFRNFHVEGVAYGMECNLKTQYAHVKVEGATGGDASVQAIITCAGDALSTATLQCENIRKNAAQYTFAIFDRVSPATRRIS